MVLTNTLLEQLETDGIAVIPGFLQGETLAAMQRAFDARLHRLRWNNFDGYERTERFRHMVQDVLTLDQGFVTAAIDPAVMETLRAYIGPGFQLVEAKGWKSLPVRRMFHGWHGDSWYDKAKVKEIPREVKLGFYLTNVRTGAFRYIKGTHRQHVPRDWRNHEIEAFDPAGIVEVSGAAGTGFLFDTTGVHGQSSPILEPREAVFYNYHDPAVPLDPENIEHYRYHPLLLNAALLGNLTPEDQAVLGFGDKRNFIAAYEREPGHEMFQAMNMRLFGFKVVSEEFSSRVRARLKRLMK